MLRFIVRILGNALAISITSFFVKDFSFPRNWELLLLAGLILAIFNAILKPLLKLISLPLIILTLGFFSLIINAALLWLLAQFMPELKIVGFWAYFWGVIIITVTNWIVVVLTRKRPKTE